MNRQVSVGLLSYCFVLIVFGRFAYKDEYEKFKLYMTIILMFGAITCLFFLNCRWENIFPLVINVVCTIATYSINACLTILLSLQRHRWNLQLFAGVVLLHIDHKGKHSHEQWLQVIFFPCLLLRNLIYDPSAVGSVQVLFLCFSGLKVGGCLTIMYPPFCQVWCLPGELYTFIYAIIHFHKPVQLRVRLHHLVFAQTCVYRPEGLMYQMFRSQFLSFSIYQSKSSESIYDTVRACILLHIYVCGIDLHLIFPFKKQQ